MASNLGTATIDFGTGAGKNEVDLVVTGQTSISATSSVEVYIMGSDTTAQHTASDHRYIGLFATFTGGDIVAATSFTIYARATFKVTGTFKVRWVWSD